MNKEVMEKFCLSWIINLIDVYLFAASINCLFQWLARGKNYDLSGFILSLVGGAYVYFVAVSSKSKQTIKYRLTVSICTIVTWLIAMPVVLNISGFQP